MSASTGPLEVPVPLVQGLWRACWDSLGGGNSSFQGGGQRRLGEIRGQDLDGQQGHQGSRSLPRGCRAPLLSDPSATWMRVS